WDHYFRMHLGSALLHLRCRFENRVRLHFSYFRKRDSKTATAMAEHRILFMQFVDTPGDLLLADTDFLRQRALGSVILWEKFVQRRIKQTNRCGFSFERFENTNEIAFLIRQQFGESFLSIVRFTRQNH